jgi:hypothetical protein
MNFATGPKGQRMDEWEVAGLSAGPLLLTQNGNASCGPVASPWRGALEAVGSHTPAVPGSNPGPATTFPQVLEAATGGDGARRPGPAEPL